MRHDGRIALRNALACWLAVFASWLALFAARGALTHAGVGDEVHYLRAATAFRAEGWRALSEGVRPPGMPLLLAGVQSLVPEAWVLPAMRCIHIALSSLIPALWVGSAGLLRPRRLGVVMGWLTALWFPLHWFSSLAIAESPSLLLLHVAVIALLLTEASDDDVRRTRLGAVIGLSLGAATLLKANILLIVPAFALLSADGAGASSLRRWRAPATVVVTALLVLAPWVAVVADRTGSPALANTNGTNLLLGSGAYLFGGAKPEEATLMDRVAPMLQASDAAPLTAAQSALLAEACTGVTDPGGVTLPCERAALHVAKELWRSRPFELATLGLAKVLHSLGFSLRGAADLFRVGVTAAAMLFPALLWRSRRYRSRLLLHLGVALPRLAIAFFWLPNQRFTVFYLDSTLLLVAGSWISMRLERTDGEQTPQVG